MRQGSENDGAIRDLALQGYATIVWFPEPQFRDFEFAGWSVKRRPAGDYVTASTVGGEVCRAFVPRPLPPDPALLLDSRLQELYDQALVAVGRLDSITTLLPDPALFLCMHVRREAVLSPQIEGTQSSTSACTSGADGGSTTISCSASAPRGTGRRGWPSS